MHRRRSRLPRQKKANEMTGKTWISRKVEKAVQFGWLFLFFLKNESESGCGWQNSYVMIQVLFQTIPYLDLTFPVFRIMM